MFIGFGVLSLKVLRKDVKGQTSDLCNGTVCEVQGSDNQPTVSRNHLIDFALHVLSLKLQQRKIHTGGRQGHQSSNSL